MNNRTEEEQRIIDDAVCRDIASNIVWQIKNTGTHGAVSGLKPGMKSKIEKLVKEMLRESDNEQGNS